MKTQIVLPAETPDLEPSQLRDIVVAAEELGYETAWLPDHLLPPEPFSDVYGGVFEPLVTLANLAAVTSSIRLGTSVVVLPLRNPFVLAKQVATVERLSDSRFTLGLGLGWDRVEFANVGATFANRAAVTDESLRLFRHLFEVGHGPFEGEYFGFVNGYFQPAPKRPIPIMVGGVSDAALRRAAASADMWQAFGLTAEEFGERVRFLRAVADRPVEVGTRDAFTGPVSEVGALAERAAASEEVGAEHFAVHFGRADGYVDRMTAFRRTYPA